MTKTKRFIALILGGAMCAALTFGAACGGSGDDDDTDSVIDNIDTTATTATVTYDSNGGSGVDASTVEIGKTIGTMPAPTRSGYNFLGWYYTYGSIEVQVTGDYPIPCDITLTAKWSKITDFCLSDQSNLVVETGEYFYCTMYDYSNELDDDAYVTLTKGGTTKTAEEAMSVGWITEDSYIYTVNSFIRPELYFGQSGDYTITGYSNGQTCTTQVTVTGESITYSTFTASTVSFDKITYFDTDYTSGSSVISYNSDYVYVYFNAPMTCEAVVTYASTTDAADKGILGTSYNSNGVVYTEYENGQYYVCMYAAYLATGYTYTVKLDSVSNGSAEASFTLAAPTGETRKITTPTTSATLSVGEEYSDSYYVVSATEIYGVRYEVKDSSGNTPDNYSCHASYDNNGNNVYRIYYYGSLYEDGTYTVTISPYDSEYNTITELVQTINVTAGSSYWSLNNTDASGQTIAHYNYFAVGESKTIEYVTSTELSKVALCGVYLNTSSATTITKYNGSTVSAIYSVADGKTTVSLTVKAADTSTIRLYLLGTNADGSIVRSGNISLSRIISTERISLINTYVASMKYSLDTYFSSLTGEGGELYEVYTALAGYTAADTLDSYFNALTITENVGMAMSERSSSVYNSGTDYISDLATALAGKTALYDTAIYYYLNNAVGISGYISGINTVTSDVDLLYLGIERYLVIETSDKDICDIIYVILFDGEDIDEVIENKDEDYNGTISALVTAHDSGTEAQYIAAINSYLLTYYALR